MHNCSLKSVCPGGSISAAVLSLVVLLFCVACGRTTDLRDSMPGGGSNASAGSLGAGDARDAAVDPAGGGAALPDAEIPDPPLPDAGVLDGEASDAEAPDASPTALRVTPERASLISGQTAIFTVSATFADQTTRDVTSQASFAAQDTNVVSMKRNVATGYIPGTTTITASALGLSGSATLEVRPGSLTSLSVTVGSIHCADSLHSVSFVATGVAANGAARNVTAQAKWATSTPALLLFSDSAPGNALCLGSGTATVSASIEGLREPTTVELQAPKVVGFKLFSPGVMRVLDETQFYTQVDFDNGTSETFYRYPSAERFNYSSSNPSVLSIDRVTGMARSLALGTSTLSAVLDGITLATALVRVSESKLLSIAVTPSRLTLTAPSRLPLSAVGTYADGTKVDITNSVHWSSSAIVAGDGWATPVRAGTSTLIASLDSQSTSIPVTVLPGTPTALEFLGGADRVPRSASVPLLVYASYATAASAQLIVSDVVSWAIGDPTVVAVGEIPTSATGLKLGNTTLSAKLGALETEAFTIAVTDVKPVAFHVGFDAAGMTVGQTLDVPAIAAFDDGADYDIANRTTFTSANPNIVTVSNLPGSRGRVTAIGPGKTSVKLKGLGMTVNIPVEVDP